MIRLAVHLQQLAAPARAAHLGNWVSLAKYYFARGPKLAEALEHRPAETLAAVFGDKNQVIVQRVNAMI